MAKMKLVKDFGRYLGENKKLWLIPILIIFLLIGVVVKIKK
jgi:hypothetical protein